MANAGDQPSSSGPESSEREYLEQKYGSREAHTYLTKEQVEGMLDNVLKTSETVKQLLEALRKVLLCHNRLQHYKEVELAVAHELIHAYDFCRAKNLDLTNCRHHACTEIRAANLSGDCTFWQEFFRGNISDAFLGQHRRCVRRRATTSVSLNPYCQGGKAEQAVKEMMPKCFHDTDPFPRIPDS